jgi:putative addiction module component (TIGR02574 family)
MGAVIDVAAIEKLSVEERLKLIELIWDTIEAQQPAVPQEILDEMERRAAESRANPESGMTLDEFETRLRALRK